MSKQIKSFKFLLEVAKSFVNKVSNTEGASLPVKMLAPESINKICEVYATKGYALTKRDKFIDLLDEPKKFKEIYNKFFSSDNFLSIENQCFFNDECLTILARKSNASQKSFDAIMSIKYNPSIYTSFSTKELLEQYPVIYKEFTPSELQEYSDEKLKCYKTAEGFYNAGLTCNKDTFNSKTCIPPKLCNSYYSISKKIIDICEDFYPLDATPEVENELAHAFSSVALLNTTENKILIGEALSND